MKLEGTIEKFIDKKKFLVRLEKGKGTPQIGDLILSTDLRPIAKVADIFGKVDSPLVLAVTLRDDIDANRFLGRKVSISSSIKERSARRRK